MRRSELPQTGPLSGLKVLVAGMNTAGPFAGAMMADFGADVIFIESPIVMDQYRTTDTKSLFNKERRNHRAMVLNVVKPEGQEIFLKMIAEADIFIENSKAGTWDKRGLSDEVLWKANPKLVICHVTGFGLTGDPTYTDRGGYDHIGQAFSGFMQLNGYPDGSPMPAPAYLGDYVTAMLASWSCLAAIYNVQKTGKGESIDCSQFEAMMMISAGFPSDWLNYNKERERAGTGSMIFAGSGPYKCKDGDIYIHFASTPTMKNGLPFLGLEYGSEDYPDSPEAYFVPKGSPQGEVVEKRLAEYCAGKTVLEAEQELNDNSIVSSAILTYEQMKTHPHFIARQVFTEWDGFEGGKVKGPTPAPRFKNNPAQIWRKGPCYGDDNEGVLLDLGYSEEEIQEFYNQGLIKKDINW